MGTRTQKGAESGQKKTLAGAGRQLKGEKKERKAVGDRARKGGDKGRAAKAVNEGEPLLLAEQAIERILGEHEFSSRFRARAIEEAQAFGELNERDILGREDFSGEFIITIDGADAKDLDDAVSLTRTEGGYKLGVHIADVAHYVKAGSALDKDAFKKGTSLYFGNSVFPMLPKELSNGHCSLSPNTNKLTLSLVVELDEEGRVVKASLTEGVINTKYRMTYDRVQEILNGALEEDERLRAMLFDMQKVALMMINEREKNGSADFDLGECEIVFDKKNVVDVRLKPRLFAHRIIEEFMLTANKVVAEAFNGAKTPFIYRVHTQPDSEKLATLQQFIAPLGLKLNVSKTGVVTPKGVAKLLSDAKKTDYFEAVAKMTLRSMQKADYRPECGGHFGLAFKYYCHFTSPIRRYPDLAIHRIIKEAIKKGVFTKITAGENKVDAFNREGKKYTGALDKLKVFTLEASRVSSEREKHAQICERDILSIYKAQFMSGNIGKEYIAKVSGVTEFGVFAELENTVEGLIFRENLPNDYYLFDGQNMAVVGKNHSFKLGDEIRVRVIKADVAIGKIEFAHADVVDIKDIGAKRNERTGVGARAGTKGGAKRGASAKGGAKRGASAKGGAKRGAATKGGAKKRSGAKKGASAKGYRKKK